jgi:hypothetical protein
MTSQAFKEWIKKNHPFGNLVGKSSAMDMFPDYWSAWQAATDAALERAAEEVEKIDKENWFAWQCAFSKHTAEAIRALKEQP